MSLLVFQLLEVRDEWSHLLPNVLYLYEVSDTVAVLPIG